MGKGQREIDDYSIIKVCETPAWLMCYVKDPASAAGAGSSGIPSIRAKMSSLRFLFHAGSPVIFNSGATLASGRLRSNRLSMSNSLQIYISREILCSEATNEDNIVRQIER